MRRSRIEIMIDILTVLSFNKLRRTKIMYKVNLSYNLLRECIDLLQKMGLISFHNGYYRITRKGMETLTLYNNLRKYLNTAGNTAYLLDLSEGSKRK